jgi:hypothetical protein
MGTYCPVDCALENQIKADLPVYPLNSVQLSLLLNKSEQSPKKEDVSAEFVVA